MIRRGRKQEPNLNDKGLNRALEKKERLAEALRKNLKRRRIKNTSITANEKPTED